MQIEIKGEFIELNKLLKIADIAPTGGIAGLMITDGAIKVDGEVEHRKRCKIRIGQTVSFENTEITVIGDEND